MKRYFLFLFIGLLFLEAGSQTQFLKPSDSLNLKRKKAVVITQASAYTIGILGLNELWYKDYPRSKFHTLDDADEWLQMDKLGHSFSTYHLTRLGAETMAWSGADKKTQLVYGIVSGLTFVTAVEVLDGYSEEWGFSWSDVAANVAGTGLYVGQELLWEEQRILLKYSFHQTKYADQNPDKLGEGLAQEIFKDYNGQTYWLSANINSFVKSETFPQWLNFAVGYGGEGMLTGVSDADDMFMNQDRNRQLYLSLDIDLSRIKTNSHFLKTVFSVFNTLKVPFPALEFSSGSKPKFHWMYF